jgi:hypothetical protein
VNASVVGRFRETVMSKSEFETSYPTIRAVVRFRRTIPLACAASATAIIICVNPTIPTAIAAVIAGAFVWLLTRLGVEIVEVIADTLLPR